MDNPSNQDNRMRDFLLTGIQNWLDRLPEQHSPMTRAACLAPLADPDIITFTTPHGQQAWIERGLRDRAYYLCMTMGTCTDPLPSRLCHKLNLPDQSRYSDAAKKLWEQIQSEPQTQPPMPH